MLVFSDPNCGPCDELSPHLQELHRRRPDLSVLVISRRDADATRAKAKALGLTFPIVMQKQWEISLKYGMFATPIGYQTNLMVYGPGGYHFSDYVKIGVPLDLLCMAVAVVVTPMVFPFNPV